MTTTFNLSILRENLLLDEKKYQSTVDALASQHESLSQIDSRITLLEAELRDLNSRRESILKDQYYNQALIAPVRRIPAEMLGEIFKECIGLQVPPWAPSRPNTLHPPLLLTRVCHRWRQIAHGTPDLWKYIPIYDLGMSLPLFRMGLQNSGSVGLDISIELALATLLLRHGGVWPRTPQETEIVQSVVEQHHRIRSLKIKAHHLIVKAILGPQRKRHLPLLQELTLTFPNYETPLPEFLTMAEADRVKGTVHAPRLHTLTIDSIHGVGMSSLIKAIRPSSCLRILNISGIFPGRPVFKFLTHCPAIEEITGHSFAITPPFPPSLDLIIMSSLRKLSVVWEKPPPDDTQCFLELFRAPMLQELAATYPEEDQNILWELVTKAGSNLRDISFTRMSLSSDEFTRAMQSLTGIRKLSFNTCTPPVGFWEMLTPAQGTPPTDWIWPQLAVVRHYYLSNCDGSDLSALTTTEEYQAALVRFVERRAPPPDMYSGGSSHEGRYLERINIFGHHFGDAAFRTLLGLRESTELQIVGLIFSRPHTPE